jgi:hypothetical protein
MASHVGQHSMALLRAAALMVDGVAHQVGHRFLYASDG